MTSVAIVGGGAAGLAAAVAAAERGCETTVYEASDRVGRSVLATGNGRCNFSNAHLEVERYWNAPFVAEALASLDARNEAKASVPIASSELATRPVLDFFARHGLVWAEEGEGRLYPASRKASSVLDVLRYPALAAGARFCCETAIASIEPPRAAGKPYTLRTRTGEFKRADAVIVAAGGSVARALLPEDVPFCEQRPVLGPLATNTDIVRMLDNTRVRARIALLDPHGHVRAVERGELLFRKYGVSGIAVFNLSRLANPGDELRISLLPADGRAGGRAGGEAGGARGCGSRTGAACADGCDIEAAVAEAERVLSARFAVLSGGAASGSLTPETFFRGMFSPVVAEAVCKQARVAYEEPLPPERLACLAQAVGAFPLTVKGAGDAKQCQVHRGGVSVEAVDPATCELYGHPGLFVVGEALDVDGPCGGYNLHWAWASGILAALCCGQ